MTTTDAAIDGERIVSDEQLAAQRIPVTQVRVATVGGGLGSFALADRLRVGGVADEDIAILGSHASPGEQFLQRCKASGLGPDDKLRSDSSARIDNLWGFPGYALQDAWRTRSIKPLAQVFGEAVISEGYTPSVGLMADTLEREAHRIGWERMSVSTAADYLFKREGGGYFVVCQTQGQLVAIRCEQVHLALGAARPRLTPEATAFREAAPESNQLTHVYEDHEHVLQQLETRGGSVIVRGSGMAASRLLERLVEARQRHRRDVHIWHVVRSWPDGSDGEQRPPRPAAFGFNHQRASYPKAAFGGQIRDDIRHLETEDERLDAIAELGATSTPHRRSWADLMDQARTAGWYDAVVGEISSLKHNGAQVVASVGLQNGERINIAVDHVVDATGLDSDAAVHPLVADLLAFSPVSVNRLGGLRVDDRFAVIGGESGDGRIFASGETARGGFYGPVDSFTGLQQAALTIADELADAGIGHHLTPLRSAREWMRWMGRKKL
jgi:hypothetical protein